MNYDIAQELSALNHIFSGEHGLLRQLEPEDFYDSVLTEIFVAFTESEDMNPMDIENALTKEDRKPYWWMEMIMGKDVYCGDSRTVLSNLRELRVKREAENFNPTGNTSEISQKFIDKGRELGALVKHDEVSIQDLAERIKTGVPKIATGFEKIDWLCKGGWAERGVYVVAARPGAGKTAYAVNIAKNVVERGQTAFFLTLEMSAEEILTRFLQCMYKKTEEEVVKNVDDMTKYLENFYVEEGHYEINRLLSQLTKHLDKDIIIIDYFSLIQVKRRTSKVQDLDDIMKKIKQFAFENKKVILLLHQMSRDQEKEKNRKPILSDLAWCSAIEQDSHFVSFLWDAAKGNDTSVSFGEKEWSKSVGKDLRLVIEKNRNGMLGQVQLDFDGSTMTFVQSSGNIE